MKIYLATQTKPDKDQGKTLTKVGGAISINELYLYYRR